MKRLALNFICKNESHIVKEMLRSALPITDLIVAVDTGSTDKTVALIREFGKKNEIPTYVFERSFDNFCNSRNFALDKLKEVVSKLHWQPDQTWAFFLDCDEIIETTGQFSKQEIINDLYYIGITDGEVLYSKNFFSNLAIDFRWVGPIHEYIVNNSSTASTGYVDDIVVVGRPEGASWKGNIEQKYLNYAEKLIEYVNQGNRSVRWLRYIGESYSTAAFTSTSRIRKQKWLLEALKYFEEALAAGTGLRREKYVDYDRIAKMKLSLKKDWNEVRAIFLEAYNSDTRHAEPLYYIIKYYAQTGQWQTAYLFSSFAVLNYHTVPGGNDMGHIEMSIYRWELLLYHLLICTNSGRTQESKLYYEKLVNLLKKKEIRFKVNELIMIRMLLFQYRLKRLL